MVTVQGAYPKQAPDQPPKLEPAAGVAVKTTCVPSAYDAAQVEPQSIPAGLELTLPEPRPYRFTWSIFGAGEKAAATERS